jgi:putative transposase
MARLSRIVIPNQPLHIMHRGNNRQNIFESDEDMIRIKEDIAHSSKGAVLIKLEGLYFLL